MRTGQLRPAGQPPRSLTAHLLHVLSQSTTNINPLLQGFRRILPGLFPERQERCERVSRKFLVIVLKGDHMSLPSLPWFRVHVAH